MLLAEELALIAIDPHTGHHRFGTRDNLNACLAGLLIAELELGDRPSAPLLEAAGEVRDSAGPKLKPVLSAMSRGLERRLGVGTWDAVVGGLIDAGLVAHAEGSLRPSHRVLDVAARDAIITRLRDAATVDQPIDVRTAVLLSMTGPAQLLEVVAPERADRKHARRRIDHALDSTAMEPVAESVRTVLAEAAAAAAAAASVAATGVVTSG
jgi:hypothetical protein